MKFPRACRYCGSPAKLVDGAGGPCLWRLDHRRLVRAGVDAPCDCDQQHHNRQRIRILLGLVAVYVLALIGAAFL